MQVSSKKKSKWTEGSWLFYFSFPIWALFLKCAQWDWGFRHYRAYGVFQLCLWAIGMWVVIDKVLVSPLVKWVWNITPQKLTRFQLIAFSTTVLSLPLVSFCYFIGEVQTLAQAQEVSITVIPAVILSTLIFDVTRSAFRWSLALTALFFFPTFVINEILGPYRTYLYLLAHDYRYEYIRTLVPALAIALYYRAHYEPTGSSWSGINAIHHSWKRSRFSQMFQSTNPGKRSLKTESES
ncbi:hypothetical protein EBQ90_07520 [bacterium]|nr:hypothetical protein [bacterium]